MWAREVFKAQQDVGYVGEAAAVGACGLGVSDRFQEGPRVQAHTVTPDLVRLEFRCANLAVQLGVTIGTLVGKPLLYRAEEGVQRLCHPPVEFISDLCWRSVVPELPTDPLENVVDSVFEAERPLAVHFSRELQVLEELNERYHQVIPPGGAGRF